jgi:hypothetical protein
MRKRPAKPERSRATPPEIVEVIAVVDLDVAAVDANGALRPPGLQR